MPIRIIPANNYQSAQLKKHGALNGFNLLNVNFMSFDLLIDQINLCDRSGIQNSSAMEVPGSEPTRASKADRYLLMNKAIKKSDPQYFGSALNFSGSNKALQATINDLEVSGDLNEGFLDSVKAASSGAISGLSQAKYKDIYSIIQAYLEGLRVYRTAGIDAEKAINVLMSAYGEEAEQKEAQRTELAVPTFFYGFTELTAPQKRIVDLLSNSAQVFFCAADPVDLIFNPSRDKAEKPAQNCELIEAPGPQFEVAEIARMIIRDIDSSKDTLRDLAIVYRDDTYRTLLIETLKRSKIPFFIKDGVRASESLTGRMLSSFLNACADKWHRADLAHFLRFYQPKIDTAYFDIATRLAGIYEDLPHLINIFNKDDLTDDILRSIERGVLISKMADAGVRKMSHDEHRRRFSEIAQALIELNNFTNKFREAKSFIEMNGAVYDVLITIKDRYLQNIEAKDDPEDLIAPLMPSELDLCEVIIAELGKVRITNSVKLSDGDELRGSKEVPGAQGLNDLGDVDLHSLYRELLTAELDKTSLPIGSFLYTGVNILPYESLRYLTFSRVFFTGMSYKSFPARQAQDPIILDSEKNIFNESGHSLKLSSERVKEEKALFLLALSSASERVILSYATHDLALEKALLPSFYILKLAEAVDNAPYDHSTLRENCSFFRKIGTEQSLENEVAFLDIEDLSMAGLRAGAMPDALLGDLNTNPLHLRRKHYYKKNIISTRETKNGGIFTDESAIKQIENYIFKDKGEFSPTLLETFAECPFKAFTERILKLSILEEPENMFEIDPRSYGSMIHKILQNFMEKHKDELRDLKSNNSAGSKTDLRDMLIASMGEIAEDEFKRFGSQGKLGNEFIWSYTRLDALADLNEFVDRELEPTLFVPKYFEANLTIRIGDLIDTIDEPTEAILAEGIIEDLDLDLDRFIDIKLSGVSDRIDIDTVNSQFMVIDYKTGKPLDGKEYDENSVNGGRTLQTPLYFYAAPVKIKDDIKTPDLLWSGAYYYYVTKKGKFSKFTYCHAGDHANLKEFLRAVMISIDLMGKGFFPAVPFPSKQRKCDYCDLSKICKTTGGIGLPDDDPRMQELSHLRESKEVAE